MLLVDDDQAERRHRREDGRARADHDRRAARRARARQASSARAVARARNAARRPARRGARESARRAAASARSRAPARARRGPPASTRSMSRRYTSVLPLPVTPCSRKAPKLPERGADPPSTAAPWSAVSTGPGRPAPAGGGGLGPREGFEPAALARARARRPGGPRPRSPRRRAVARRASATSACWRRAETRARRDRRAAGIREPPDDLLAHGGRALAQHLRHRAEQHVAERVVVVVGGPAQQAESRRRPRAASCRSPRSRTSGARAAASSPSACAATMPIARRRPSGTRTRSPGARRSRSPRRAGSRNAAASACRKRPAGWASGWSKNSFKSVSCEIHRRRRQPPRGCHVISPWPAAEIGRRWRTSR